MNKLWLIGLTASALGTPAAAQTVADPSSAWGIEAARLNVPVAASAAAAAMDDRAVVQGMRHVMRHGGDRRGHHRWNRIHRGGFVSSFWFGPQFVISDWGMYGFSNPGRGRRWIRYYDDALLIDSYGRVHDGRWGYDWGRWSDRWSYRDGIPVYVGDGDFEPSDRDYEWAERWDDRRRGDRRSGRSGRYDRRGPPPMDQCGRGPCGPTPVYGHGGYGAPAGHGGYGYGAYGYGGCACGPMVITETTTTTAPVVEEVTTYEYITEEVAPRRAYRAPARRAPVRRAPAPPPRPGERG